MKGFSRRMFMQAVPAVGLGAKNAALSVTQSLAQGSAKQAVAGFGVSADYANPTPSTRIPKMAKDVAMEVARRDPFLRRQIEDYIARQDERYNTGIPSIDHDILRKRSWSDAAKIFAQKERNRAKRLEQAFQLDADETHPVYDYLNKLMFK